MEQFFYRTNKRPWSERSDHGLFIACTRLFLLCHQFIVFFVAPDPEPKQPAGDLYSNCAIMEADPDRPKTVNFLQV